MKCMREYRKLRNQTPSPKEKKAAAEKLRRKSLEQFFLRHGFDAGMNGIPRNEGGDMPPTKSR